MSFHTTRFELTKISRFRVLAAAQRLAVATAIAFVAVLAGILSPPTLAKDTDAQVRHTLATLSGPYRSVTPEPWGRGTYGTREFTFNKGSWTLRFVLALDPEMQNPVFEFHTYGHYFVGQRSVAVPTAFDALFLEDAKFVTLRTRDPQLAKAFGLDGCGLTVNVEKDISATGCALWKPVNVCNEDHDLLAIDAQGALYFGQRPEDNNMCTADRRPKALLPPVKKR